MKKTVFPLLLCGLLLQSSGQVNAEGQKPIAIQATPSFSLEYLSQLLQTHSPALAASQAHTDAAQAGVKTARAWPNPEIEWSQGKIQSRGVAGSQSNVQAQTVTQTIDWPWVRAPRIDAASASYREQMADQEVVRSEQLAQLKVYFYELLRRKEEARSAEEDVRLLESVKSRVAIKVSTGEVAKYELIKTEAELLNARKSYQASSARVSQTKNMLRALTGATLPPQFEVTGSFPTRPTLKQTDALAQLSPAHNARLARAEAEYERTQAQYQHQKQLRWPTTSVSYTQTREVDYQQRIISLQVQVPLWDWRTGPVQEAAALSRKASYQRDLERLTVRTQLETAYRQVEIAQSQVQALEEGIVKQAEAALQVAQTAYRYGERSILEVFDAQRVYRAARADLTQARYDLAVAIVEIEKILTASAAQAHTD